MREAPGSQQARRDRKADVLASRNSSFCVFIFILNLKNAIVYQNIFRYVRCSVTCCVSVCTRLIFLCVRLAQAQSHRQKEQLRCSEPAGTPCDRRWCYLIRTQFRSFPGTRATCLESVLRYRASFSHPTPNPYLCKYRLLSALLFLSQARQAHFFTLHPFSLPFTPFCISLLRYFLMILAFVLSQDWGSLWVGAGS